MFGVFQTHTFVDTNGKLEGMENVIAVLKIRTEQIEEELAKYRNISEKLNTWIDESDVKIANAVRLCEKTNNFTMFLWRFLFEKQKVRTNLKSATNESESEEMVKPRNPDGG